MRTYIYNIIVILYIIIIYILFFKPKEVIKIRLCLFSYFKQLISVELTLFRVLLSI